MRVERSKGRRAIPAGLVAIAIGIFCLSTIERLENPTGSARLVSIEQLPDVGEMCLPEESAGSD